MFVVSVVVRCWGMMLFKLWGRLKSSLLCVVYRGSF